MATYRVTDPTTGKTIKLTGDSPPTEQELNDIFSSVRGATPSMPSSTTPLQQLGTDLKNSNGVMGTANTLLKAPEKMSSQGLNMLAGMVPNPEPTGNLPLDVAKGTPRILADTVAKVAPGFVSKGAILTSGALNAAKTSAPLLKMIGAGAASQLESASGAVPGSLTAAANDSGLIFAPGKKAAGPLYEAGKAEMEGASLFKGMSDPKQILSTAQEYMAKGGVLEPAEALTARKATDILMRSKSVVKDELVPLRDTFDQMAKSSSNISEADAAFQKGNMASSLRNILPQNKYGGASPFKTMLLKLTGGAAAPVLSPAVQGAMATAGGAAVRNVIAPLADNPAVGTAIPLTVDKAMEYLKKAKGNKDKARQLATKDGWTIPD